METDFANRQASGPVIHPKIALLVRQLDRIQSLLAAGPQGGPQAVLEMRLVALGLRPEDQASPEGEALLGDLDLASREVQATKGRNYAHREAQVLNLSRMRMGDYISLFQRLNGLLWRKGYFSAEFYNKAVPTAGDRQSGDEPRPGLPKVMDSRIK